MSLSHVIILLGAPESGKTYWLWHSNEIDPTQYVHFICDSNGVNIKKEVEILLQRAQYNPDPTIKLVLDGIYNPKILDTVYDWLTMYLIPADKITFKCFERVLPRFIMNRAKDNYITNDEPNQTKHTTFSTIGEVEKWLETHPLDQEEGLMQYPVYAAALGAPKRSNEAVMQFVTDATEIMKSHFIFIQDKPDIIEHLKSLALDVRIADFMNQGKTLVQSIYFQVKSHSIPDPSLLDQQIDYMQNAVELLTTLYAETAANVSPEFAEQLMDAQFNREIDALHDKQTALTATLAKTRNELAKIKADRAAAMDPAAADNAAKASQIYMRAITDAFAVVPDFPKPGIMFRDVTPLLLRPELFDAAMDEAAKRITAAGLEFDYIAGVESRGFLLTALALRMGKGFAMIRKRGKLPNAFSLGDSAAYGTEYSQGDVLCISTAIPKRSRLLIVDDVLVTGGTMAAAAELAVAYGCTVAGFFVLVELTGVAMNPAFDREREKMVALVSLTS